MTLRTALACCMLLSCSGTTTGDIADASLADDVRINNDRPTPHEVFDDAGPDVRLDRPDDAISMTDGNGDTDLGSVTSDVPRDTVMTHDSADGLDPLQAPRCGPPYQSPIATNYSTLLYPPTTIAVFGAASGSEASQDTEARWLGTRPLSQPFLAQCGPGETAHPCTLDRLLRLQLPSMQIIELLLSVDYDALDPPVLNAPVRLSLNVNRGGYQASNITIHDAQGRIVLAAISNRMPGGDSWRVGGLDLWVAPSEVLPTCLSFAQPMCERIFGSYPLRVTPHSAETFAVQEVPAATTATFSTLHGRYRVVHRKTLRQIQGFCSSPPISESQFEVIRLRD